MIEKYINPFTDFGFKKIFGEEANSELLIDFLNQLIPDRGNITQLTYLKTEHLGAAQEDRRAIFDLYCENERGEKFIVELQKAKQKFFKDRSLYYSTFAIQTQAKTGEWDFELQTVYTIAIMDFVFDDSMSAQDKFIHDIRLVDIQNGEVFNDKLRYIYLEMPKFKKTEAELDTHFDKWLYLLKNLSALQSVPVHLQERIFQKLFKAAEIAQYSAEERQAYQTSLKYYRDMKNVLDTAHEIGFIEGLEDGLQQGLEKGREKGLEEGLEKGREEGLQQGIEEGRKNEKMGIARQMIQKGFADEDIAVITGLSEEELRHLRQNIS